MNSYILNTIITMTMAPVNVSGTCITISADYVCVVRFGTAQDQAYHLLPHTTAQ